MRGMAREYAAGNYRGPGWREFAGTLGQLQAGRQAGSGMACSRAMARRVSGSAWRLSKWVPQFPGRSASADGRAGSCGQRRQYRGRRRANTPFSGGLFISVRSGVPSCDAAGVLPVQGRADGVGQSVLAPSNSGVESHRPVRVLDYDTAQPQPNSNVTAPTGPGAV